MPVTSPAQGRARALLIAGSPSDLDLVLKSQEVLDDLEIPSEIRVLSAHRTPDRVVDVARSAEADGFEVIIAFAGMAAHLAGVVAAYTLLPVIAVPVASGSLRGIDAALSSLQMPPGTPVAAVAIDGARNGALMAARMLALREPEIRSRLGRMLERERERYEPAKIEAEIARRRRANQTPRE